MWLVGACSEPASPESHEPTVDAESSDAQVDVATSNATAAPVPKGEDAGGEKHAEKAPVSAPTAHDEHAPKPKVIESHSSSGEHDAAHHGATQVDAVRTPPVRRPPPRGTLPDFYDSVEAERLDQLWTRPGVTVVMAKRRPFDGVIEVATDRVPDETTAERRRREFARLGFEAWPPSPRPELAPVGDPALARCPFLISDDRTGMPLDPSLDSRSGRGVIVCAQNLDELEALVRGNIASAVAVKRAAPCRELFRVDPEARNGAGAMQAPKTRKHSDDVARSRSPKAKGKREPPSRHSRASLQAMRAICRDLRAMFVLGYPFRTAPMDH